MAAMKFLARWAGLAGVALTAHPAFAAPLELKAAVGLALSRNVELKAAEERWNQARHQSSALWSTLLPRIGASGSAAYRKDAVANRTVGSVAFGGTPYNLYSVSLSGEQPIFVYGSFAAIRAGNRESDARRVDFEIAEREVVRNVIAAYYKVILWRNRVDILEEQQKVIAETLATAQNRLRLGGRKMDVLQVRTQQALLKPKVQTAKIELESAAAELATIIGEQSGGALQLRNRLPTLKLKEVEGSLNLQEFRLAELERLRLEREQVGEQKSVALGKNLPQLKLAGDYNFLNYTKADLFDPASNSWQVQLVLSVPLFSGLSSIYDRMALNARDAELELREEDTRLDLILAQVKSRKALEAAEASLTSAEEAVQVSRESMAEARKNYRFGIIDFLQFMQVQQADFEAISSLNQLKYDAIVAYANYFRASGQPVAKLVEFLQAEDQK
jgi:outer membrane protein TolC